MKLCAKVLRVWQEIKTIPHALSSFSMATKGDTPKKPANVQRAITSVNDNCRLCCCPLKIKYRELKKIRIFQRKTFSRSRSAKDANKVWLWQNSVHTLDWKLKNQTRPLIEYVMPVLGKYGTHLSSITSSPQTWKERRITRLWWKLMTILVDSSGFCQQPFHRQIEVLKPEKGRKQLDKNLQRKNPYDLEMFRALWLTLTAITTKSLRSSTLNTANDSPHEAGELFLSYLNVEDVLESSSTEVKVVLNC